MASSGILPASSQLAMPAFQTCICGVSWPLRTSSCNCTGLNGPAGCPLIETCQATCGIGGGVDDASEVQRVGLHGIKIGTAP